MAGNEIFRSKSFHFISLFVSAIALLLAAFYNGYPLVYSDTSTYLSSGFELETPVDRPITYGLFLRIFSLNGFSLWIAAFAQSLLLAWLIYRLFVVLKIENPSFKTMICILVCVFTTGVSWVSSQLIADVFTPMLILLWVIIFSGKEADAKKDFLNYFLLLLVTSMHMSHLLMTVGFLTILLILRIFKVNRDKFSKKKMAMVFLFSVLAFPVFASSYSKFKNVFFAGKIEESGLLKEVLDNNCKTHNFKLCLYKDSMPGNTNDFIWKENSPLQKAGGYSGAKEELKEIKSIVLSTPKYLQKFLVLIITDSWKQLYTFRTGDGNGIFMNGTKLYERIKLFAPHDIKMYEASRQQQGLLINGESIYSYFVTIIIICCLILLYFFSRNYIRHYSFLILAIVSGIILNAIVCGSLTAVADRFQCRVIWLLVFLVTVLFWPGKNTIHQKKEA